MQFSGYAFITDELCVAFDYSEGIITLYPGKYYKSLEGLQFIIGHLRDCDKYILFHLSIPINGISDKVFIPTLCSKFNVNVDWYIEDFHETLLYTDMKFSFPELDHFFPSLGMAEYDSSTLTFKARNKHRMTFTIDILKKKCDVSFVTYTKHTMSDITSATTATYLNVHFEATDYFDFFIAVRQVIHNVFAFIYNRQNITPAKIYITDRFHSSKLVYLNKYREPPEEIASNNELHINYYVEHLKELLQHIADNRISIGSLNKSSRMRNYIDLSQSLSITAAFEFYVREYLPEMRHDPDNSEQELFCELETLKKRLTGKNKKMIKNFLKHMKDIPLSEKIMKIFYGYASWQGLKDILQDFPADVDILAEEINQWRNELAHEKRDYSPSIKTVEAVRLVERLNYCIVLRHLHYTDENIREIMRITFRSEWQPPKPDIRTHQ